MKRIWKLIIAAAAVFIVSFTINAAYLSNRVKPPLAIPWRTADDGGSGMYYGFGCAFRVKVRLTPEAEQPTVVAYDAYVLGIPVYRGIE